MVRNDFRGMYSNTECPLGCGNSDTIQHIPACSSLSKYMSSESITKNKVEFQDIYSDCIVKPKRNNTPVYSTHGHTRKTHKKCTSVTGPVHLFAKSYYIFISL